MDTLERIPVDELMHKIEAGFVAYSQGKVNILPVGHLHFDDPPADIHVKHGYILANDYYVVKIASSFYRNPEINLPSSNGLMLIFSKNTGELLSVLLDGGYLTDVRTAIAGAVAAKYLTPSKVTCIGIIGAGTQARLQLIYLRKVIDCHHVMVWGRDAEKLKKYASNMDYLGVDIMGCFILSATCAWSYNVSNYVSQTNLKVGIIYGDRLISTKLNRVL